MPYSSESGKNLVDRTVLRLLKQTNLMNNKKILDLGVGSGTYSDRYSNSLLSRNKFKWTGVEIWQPYYEKFNLNSKYDRLFCVDARTIDFGDERFDITFIGDILEHMTQEEAIRLVDYALKISNVVIISIPIGYYPQGEYDGNPYETHVKDNWTHEEAMESFSEKNKGDLFPNVAFWGIEKEIGVYVCSRIDFQSRIILYRSLEPQIGVYAICKNEENFIERMINSVRDANFIQICDTGSTDGTFRKLRKIVEDKKNEERSFPGRPKEIQIGFDDDGRVVSASLGIFSLQSITIAPWRFDDARNTALSLLPEELDLCISIDADEIMEEGWKPLLDAEILKDLHERGRVHDRYYHKFSTIWNWEQDGSNFTDHWHERIHTRKAYIWKLPVHEVLVKGDLTNESIKWLGGIKIIQKPDNSKSRSSYLKMMEIAIQEDPNRWKLLSFYAGDLTNLGRYDDAIVAIKKAMLIPDCDISYLHNQLARVYQASGNIEKAITEMTTASILNETSREFKVYVSELYMTTKNFSKAYHWIMMADEIKNKPSGYGFDVNCWNQNYEDLKVLIKTNLEELK